MMWRCEQIRRRYVADVYIQVRYNNRYYEYTSSNQHSFPRSRAELEATYPIPVIRSPLDFEGRRSRSEIKRST
ncbi:hypothetical protein CGMCC3_g17383 [Colletotrichum fructicola]|uniref:Uncharacterized protein n=1 Tax=Colletotrichum fructicola (strain Nara gc5) TaxID=1213859 RepID=A0A7J6IEU6_COLFN|nr:uncharacterized protein CGMCC3_g17383 [Colletotrichum fructicola]KAE9566462.1 hypothetical protein CGMCC3_g17383 [Colletotrichum fructicola]KAF4423196.1 hypothetical protein CFRS1_v004936 [Colletotrichum fructicola]KAF4474930.1 hypothetical protein CGGC5_v016089 [Colletotrichum fructicola Nara gc5]KAF4486676.1 hypothetical protein CGGC5_v005976 [Colletotrichum fructicola Nara gc5]